MGGYYKYIYLKYKYIEINLLYYSNMSTMSNIHESMDLDINNYELMDILTYCEDAIGMKNIPDIENRLYER